jgi:bacterioferritin-associated ferredoxin
MYVCVCHAVTDRDIGTAVAEGCCSLRELRQQLGVASCCGRCASCARSVLQESLNALPHHHAAATLQMSAA